MGELDRVITEGRQLAESEPKPELTVSEQVDEVKRRLRLLLAQIIELSERLG